MPISKLSFSNVGPFDEVEFEFDPQVNVFTGPNNSGKSSVLWVLGEIAVFPFNFPKKLLRHGRDAKFTLHLQIDFENVFRGALPLEARIKDPSPGDHVWNTEEEFLSYIAQMLEMIGFSKFIPALRRSTDFRSTGPIPTHVERDQRRKMTQEMPDPKLRRRYRLVSEDASLVSDEDVVQEIIDLDYRSYLRQESAFRNIVVQIGEIASEITDGFPIQFSGVGEDDDGFFPEFSTVDGPMPLNTMSQGTQSVVQWLAHLLIGYAAYYDFPKNLEEKPGVLIVDEIDAHLHPSWQRRIIPALTNNFPNLQIFCSTHSPLMLAGLKAGQVHLLQRDEDNRVTVSRNEVDIAGWSADEILRNFLGVPEPTDQKTVENLERLRELRRKRELSPEESEELESLRESVSEDLLSGPVVAQIERFTQALKEARTDGEL